MKLEKGINVNIFIIHQRTIKAIEELQKNNYQTHKQTDTKVSTAMERLDLKN